MEPTISNPFDGAQNPDDLHFPHPMFGLYQDILLFLQQPRHSLGGLGVGNMSERLSRCGLKPMSSFLVCEQRTFQAYRLCHSRIPQGR